MVAGNICPKEFLTKSTVEGLRVTISSTIDLSKYLLESCGYEYVLTLSCTGFHNYFDLYCTEDFF